MPIRYVAVALLAFPLALVLSASLTQQAGAQTPCVDGQAGEYACEGIDLLGHIPLEDLWDATGSRGNDMWGWTDPETGLEYALVGNQIGTIFVDVSTPTAPEIIGRLPSECSSAPSWRDMKVYADHAFIVADGCDHGIQVFDLTRLGDVTNPPETFTPDAHYTGVSNTHNIIILEEAGLAFPVGSSACSSGLEIVDISDPDNLTHVGCHTDAPTSYVHDARCVRYEGPDTDYVGDDICFNGAADQFGGSSENYVTIVNVSDPTDPELISRVYYAPGASYAHQLWLSDDSRFVFLDDELTESLGGTRTYVFDLEDLDNPEFLYMHQGETDSRAHNLYILDGFAYQSNYAGGLRVLDVRNPLEPDSIQEIAFFDTYPLDDDGDFDGTWSNYPFFESGIVVVNDRDNGLFILQATALPNDTTPGPTPPDQLVVRLTGPNPATTQTAVSINAPADQEVAVDLIDTEGRVLQEISSRFVRAGHGTTVSIDVRDVPAGTYFLRVQGEQEIVTKRIAVVK